MARLEALSGKTCPKCADWPEEIVLRIVEVIVEPGEPIPPPPDEPDPTLWGPCEVCGRTLKSKVIALE
jgi:hypothetical protein